ncbi:MAG: hypothetical protein KJ690_17985 [Alphaproteobacteria bacterium]|nr:hypothetical protein [Alphaproteobacteria bacterium]
MSCQDTFSNEEIERFRPLGDAVTDLALQGCSDPPGEAIRRLCAGEWVAEAKLSWRVWAGTNYQKERRGIVPVKRWEGLRDALARKLDLPWGDSEPLPNLGDRTIFADELPDTECAVWDWKHRRFETALLIAPGREEWFSAIDIHVGFATSALPSPSASPSAESPDRGGRPPLWDWEEAALEMAGRNFDGDLKPETIADVVRALQEWAGETGRSLSHSTAYPHAKRIFEAIRIWDARHEN